MFCRSTKGPKEKTAKTQVSSVCQTYIEPSAIALYDYEPAAIDDLSFNVSDGQLNCLASSLFCNLRRVCVGS